MKCVKRNCQGEMTKQVVQLSQGLVEYYAHYTCSTVWIDHQGILKGKADYKKRKKTGISEYSCPRCRNLFLDEMEYLKGEAVKVYQCRACQGIKVAFGKDKNRKDSTLKRGLLNELVNKIRLVFQHDRQQKKVARLPRGFKIQKVKETEFCCPACQGELSQYRVLEEESGINREFDICGECYGIWLDREDRYRSRSKAAKQGTGKGMELNIDLDMILPTSRTCPKCQNTKLVALKYQELKTIIDCCPSCQGTWLDGGELEEFARYLNRQGQDVIDILIDNGIFQYPLIGRVLEQFSVALHQLEVQKEEQDQNLEQASEIQRNLLVNYQEGKSTTIHDFHRCQVVSHWYPARVVGGDYYDLIPLKQGGEEYLGICIADVSGKGLPASLLMANLQALLRAFASSNIHSPAQLCSRLNSILYQNTTSQKFITFFYGILNMNNGEFKYTNAGHNPPVLLSGGKVKWLKKGGTVLSFMPGWNYEEGELYLAPRDRILLYTDGVSESENPGGEEFGEARLAVLMKGLKRKKIKESMDLIVRDLREFNQGNYRDDTTMLLLQRER